MSQPLSQEAKQEQLQANFRQCFSQQQQLLLWERSASLRSGPIAPDQDGLIEKIGSRFRLEGMERPCTQLLLSLQQMNLKFIRPGRVPKWRQTLQLFRLVAAPGQGKVCNSNIQLDLICSAICRTSVAGLQKNLDVPCNHLELQMSA